MFTCCVRAEEAVQTSRGHLLCAEPSLTSQFTDKLKYRKISSNLGSCRQVGPVSRDRHSAVENKHTSVPGCYCYLMRANDKKSHVHVAVIRQWSPEQRDRSRRQTKVNRPSRMQQDVFVQSAPVHVFMCLCCCCFVSLLFCLFAAAVLSESREAYERIDSA